MSTIPLSLSGEIPALLRRFACTQPLSMDDLVVLAARCRLETVRAGQPVFPRGAPDGQAVLLVSGRLLLAAGEGGSRHLDALSPAAGYPVGDVAALADTEATVLRLDGGDLGPWLPAPPEPAPPPASAPILARSWLMPPETVLDFGAPDPLAGHRLRLLSGDLALPSLPAVALDACRAIDRDDADAPTVARVLLNDPAITAKLLRAANGPLFYGRVAVDGCERAVLRLGLRATRRLVVAFAMRDVFRGGHAGLERMAGDLWAHSVEVASLAFVLARLCGGFEPEQAQLAGLLHDIGAVPVLAYADAETALRHDPRTVQALVSGLRVPLGRRLLEAWGLETALGDVVEQAENWGRAGDGPADLGDLVQVAQWLALDAAVAAAERPALERLRAFQRLGRGRLTAASLRALVDEAAEQVGEIRALLRG